MTLLGLSMLCQQPLRSSRQALDPNRLHLSPGVMTGSEQPCWLGLIWLSFLPSCIAEIGDALFGDTQIPFPPPPCMAGHSCHDTVLP